MEQTLRPYAVFNLNMKKEQQAYNSKVMNISIRIALIFGNRCESSENYISESRNFFFIFPAAADKDCYTAPTSSISDTAYIHRRNLGQI
jgi:hypothetical protein